MLGAQHLLPDQQRAAALALLYPGGQGKADGAGRTSAETAETGLFGLFGFLLRIADTGAHCVSPI
jgi:hypothetical protein